jgi:uncharacterized coiled-coil protein SlyX
MSWLEDRVWKMEGRLSDLERVQSILIQSEKNLADAHAVLVSAQERLDRGQAWLAELSAKHESRQEGWEADTRQREAERDARIKDHEEKMNILIQMLDELIRRRPPQPPNQ